MVRRVLRRRGPAVNRKCRARCEARVVAEEEGQERRDLLGAGIPPGGVWRGWLDAVDVPPDPEELVVRRSVDIAAGQSFDADATAIVGQRASWETRVIDAFISYSSVNRALARRLERALERRGLDVWLDSSDIAPGSMLRVGLREAIRDSGVLVLLWSEAASQSRFVNSEWITAVLLERPILPCPLDATELPACLAGPTLAAEAAPLADSIRAASGTATALAPVLRCQTAELSAAVAELTKLELAALSAGKGEAGTRARRVADAAMARALMRWPRDPELACFAAYSLKNAYMAEHYDELVSGFAPPDERLERAERHFFDTLCVDPNDPSAINGLAMVLAFEHEPEAAEFFLLAAMKAAERTGGAYAAAEHDLDLARRQIALGTFSGQVAIGRR